MLEADHILREPDRNELFARAARAIGEAEKTLDRRGNFGMIEARSALQQVVMAQQSMLMLIVKIERMAENAIRSR